MPVSTPSVVYLVTAALHVLSLLLWIGSLVSITRVLGAADGEADAVRAKLASTARKIYRAVASPWMGIAVLTGIVLMLRYPQNWQARSLDMSGTRWLFKQGFWHTKLLGVVVMLALHFVLGGRVRRAEREGAPPGQAATMRGVQIGVLVTAAVIVMCIYVWRRAIVPGCPPLISG